MQFKADQKYVAEILQNGNKFVIPDYQRIYSWTQNECETLWRDILESFDNKSGEYFLGSVVTYQNENKELEIIDGQQRLTTFTLFFRAIYECWKTEGRKKSYIDKFGECIWKYDMSNECFIYDDRHLDSRVAFEKDEYVLNIILGENITESLQKSESLYAKNYFYFYKTLQDYKRQRSTDWKDFCNFVLGKYLFVLLVVCDSQESAMTIFNTLNSRGMPLSNADILKGYVYKVKSNEKEKKQFAKDWKQLGEKVGDKQPIENLDFLFLQYMHIIRAIKNDTDTTTQSMLNFFTKKDEKKKCYGALDEWLYKDETMPFMENLANFWTNPSDYLSSLSCRYMNVLSLFQNASWQSFVSSLVWKNRECFKEENFKNQEFDKEVFSKDFDTYLRELIKYITLPFLNYDAGTNRIDEIVFKLNANVLNGQNLSKNLTQKHEFPIFDNFKEFCEYYPRKMKYILYLDSFLFNDFKSDIKVAIKDLQIEHILPRKWQDIECYGWTKSSWEKYLEQVGNKILLDSKTNQKCSDNFFSYKQEKYKEADKSLKEVAKLANRAKKNWDEKDIQKRNKEIYERLKTFFRQ